MYFNFNELVFSCGYQIKRYRESNHLSQSELAELVCVSKNSISLYERDLMQPSLTVLMRLSYVFRVPVERLVVVSFI